MIEKQRKLRNKTEKHECFFKNSRNERTKTGTTLYQQRLRAKIHTVYSQDIYLVAYQNLDLLLKSKIEKDTKYY